MSFSPPPPFLLVELATKKKAPPPSSDSPPPDESSPPPPDDKASPPPSSEKSPPPPTDQETPPPVSSSPPPPPDEKNSPPPPPDKSKSPPPESEASPPPPSPIAPPTDSSPPPPNEVSPPPPKGKRSPPPAAPPPATPVSPPPPNNDAPPPATPVSPPPPNNDAPPPATPVSPPPPINDAPPPATPVSPPPPSNDAPPPSDQSPPPNNATPPPPTDHQVAPPSPALPTSPPPHATPPVLNAPPPPKIAPSPSNNSAYAPPPPQISPRSPHSPPSNSSTKGAPAASPLPPVQTKRTVTDKASPANQGREAHTVVVASLAGLLALSLLVMAVWLVKKRKQRTKKGVLDIYRLPSQYSSSHSAESSFLKPPRPLHESQSPSEFMFPDEPGNATSRSGGGGDGGISNSRSWFTYQELSDATDRFSSSNLLGEGGFGCVYKGRLQDGKIVAVKQLKVGSGQGEREFRAEVDIISRIHHRHLVSLVGYCISDRQRLLVYEYIANDTLENHLHAEPVLSWTNRVKIAIGSARGLAYLHEDCHPRIIHRDIKSANILLDENYESRVADFGLARLASDTYTHVSTRVMGTFGYMAPEYASSGKLTEKSDVYSFGVVLLELITGRKPVDLSQEESLVEWARPLLVQALETEDFRELADPRLENNYIDAEMFRMIEAAGACVRHSGSKRPKMGQVVRAFDSMGELADLTNGVKPGQSGIFNTAEQSAQMRMFQRMAFGSQEYSNGFFNETQSSWSSGSNSLASRAGPRL